MKGCVRLLHTRDILALCPLQFHNLHAASVLKRLGNAQVLCQLRDLVLHLFTPPPHSRTSIHTQIDRRWQDISRRHLLSPQHNPLPALCLRCASIESIESIALSVSLYRDTGTARERRRRERETERERERERERKRKAERTRRER